jgi:hypothetical protein
MQDRGETCVRIFAKVVRGPIPRVQKAITLRTAIAMSASIGGPIPCVQFVFLGLPLRTFCLKTSLFHQIHPKYYFSGLTTHKLNFETKIDKFTCI